MKLLLNTLTGDLLPYPRQDEEPIIGLSPTLQVLTVEQVDPPAFDPATQQLEATEVIDKTSGKVTRSWKVVPIPPAPAPVVFTTAEKLAGLGLTLGDLTALVALTHPREWDAAVDYTIGERVLHGGRTWVATSNNRSNEPDDVPGDWAVVA
jgi:hypothetical protein